MPELPEIVCRARQMSSVLSGKPICSVEIRQPKCLNVTPNAFRDGLMGAVIQRTYSHGKWLFTETSQSHLLINMGMGGELLLVREDEMPDKWRVALHLDDDTALSINFWWFGHAHFVRPGQLDTHKLTTKLGPNAVDVTVEEFGSLLEGRRARVKSFLLDQTRIAGIGNAYVHDILFRARLHPLLTVDMLDASQIRRLHRAMVSELQRSIDKGGAWYEVDLFGQPGGFSRNDLIIAYREDTPCPECGSTIEKIKTGNTSSFICPACQPLDPG